MAFLGSVVAIALALGLGLLGVLLFARVVVSLWPGSLMLDLRRQLFLLTQPFLEPLSGWFSFRMGGMDWTALVLSIVCFLMAKGLVPWLAWAGFRLSSG